jgi:hypothetical protein
VTFLHLFYFVLHVCFSENFVLNLTGRFVFSAFQPFLDPTSYAVPIRLYANEILIMLCCYYNFRFWFSRGLLDHVDICMCVCVCVFRNFRFSLSASHTVFPFFLFFSFPITCNCGSLPLRRQYCLRLIHPHGPWPGSREAKVYIHTRRNGRYIEETFWNRARKKSIRTAQAYIEKSSPFPPCI